SAWQKRREADGSPARTAWTARTPRDSTFLWKSDRARCHARAERPRRGGGPRPERRSLVGYAVGNSVVSGSGGRREIVGGGLAGALVLDDLVIDLLTLIKAVEARALHRGNVHKHVRPALVRLNEAVALLPVEPFHSAGSHIDPSRSL